MPLAVARADRPALHRCSDVELAARYQAGSDDALEVLLDRYRRFARNRARSYFVVGGDRDDVEQEALIGLYKAARDFRPEHQAGFRAFAELCITRQILTAVKAATRQKHQALNGYVSISGAGGADDGSVDDGPAVEPTDAAAPADLAEGLVVAEAYGVVRDRMREVLSPFEVEVLRGYVDGRTYQQIGEELGRPAKSIDNAIQRIKRKVELALVERAHAERAAEVAAGLVGGRTVPLARTA